MKEQKLSAEKSIDIRFQDVDMMQVVWHGAYITYMEDAREAFGEQHGLSYKLFIAEKIMTPMVDMQVKYLRPLRYGMKPVIRISYRPSDAAKIIFDYEIFDPEKGWVYLRAQTTQVFMDFDYNLLWYSPEFYLNWKKEHGLE